MTTPTKTLEQSSDLLMEKIVDADNLVCAWNKVRSNGGAPGPDGITIADFPNHCRERWPVIKQQLLDGTYHPSPARRKSIPKPDGSLRHLGIPNVMDRVIQQAVLQVLTPIFDPGFSESSFGFRPKRSAQDAAKQVQRYIRSGYRHCIDMDLSKFFDRVQHDVLMVRVARKVHDRRLLKLIGRYLRAGVMVERELYFQGWVGYFRLVPIKTYFAALDKWVRRRIRSCYWKQWRGPWTRIANLRRLGVKEDEAVTHGCSRKGPWVMSSSRAVHEALSLEQLTHDGLVSLLTIWQTLTAKDLNRPVRTRMPGGVGGASE